MPVSEAKKAELQRRGSLVAALWVLGFTDQQIAELINTTAPNIQYDRRRMPELKGTERPAKSQVFSAMLRKYSRVTLSR